MTDIMLFSGQTSYIQLHLVFSVMCQGLFCLTTAYREQSHKNCTSFMACCIHENHTELLNRNTGQTARVSTFPFNWLERKTYSMILIKICPPDLKMKITMIYDFFQFCKNVKAYRVSLSAFWLTNSKTSGNKYGLTSVLCIYGNICQY